MPSDVARPVEILFSYTHKDEDLRDELEVHMASLKRSGRIKCWHDRQIKAGSEWNLNISDHLRTADIILLLISPDFVASEYCNDIEVTHALERHAKGEACVIPVILRRCDWKKERFSILQAVPKNGKPVKDFSDHDHAFFEIVTEIRKVIDSIEEKRKSAAS